MRNRHDGPDRGEGGAELRSRSSYPSWGYGNSGTRFKVFTQPGVPRTPRKRSTMPPRCTRTPGGAHVSLHIPWDEVEDYAALASYADEGHHMGAINSNIFQDDDYKLGSVTTPIPGSARKALAHLLGMRRHHGRHRSRDLKLWFADSTNYPGQDDIPARQDRLAEALAAVYARLGDDQRMLLEYKLFEPAFYTTDVPDWGIPPLRPLPQTRPQGHRWWSTPGTTRPAPTSSSSWPCCCGRQARRLRLQLPLLRR